MYAEALISQSALQNNISVVKSLATNAKIVAMIKANAYGHHIDLISPLVNNADVLAISEISEAKNLRKITDKPILILSGVYSEEDIDDVIKLDCKVVVHTNYQVELLKNITKPISVWLKIDTGMHRLGLSSNEYKNAVDIFGANKHIDINCVMSHFACSDEINNPMNATQLDVFNNLDIKHNKSMANSGAIMSNAQSLFDYVRPGIMLYGASPFGTKHKLLKSVMQLVAPILAIRTVKSGDSIGYGQAFVADKDLTIATIGIGYGDGYPRHAKNNTPVSINGTTCPLVGRVSMDLITVDISNVNAQIGDIATLWGDENTPIETIAKCADTIAYELLTSVNSRVKFIQSA